MVAEYVVSGFLVIAGIFGFAGSFGLIKLRDPMQRLHAPTKATTLGVGGVLIASMLYFLLVKGQLSFHELMITIFLFLTAPVSATFIAKAYLLRHAAPDDLPQSGRAAGWGLYDDPPGSEAAATDKPD